MTFERFQAMRDEAYREMIEKENERLQWVRDLSRKSDIRELLVNPWLLFESHIKNIIENHLEI